MSSRALSVDESDAAMSAEDATHNAASVNSSVLGQPMEDTVIVAEFSEHEGPVPLETFPPTPPYFDINSFVVRTLSADYQRSSDPASTADDSQVVFRVILDVPDKEADAHLTAYVQHFTLYDIHARGYVRPVCMSFVTLDPSKILDNFADLLAEFSRVSAMLKTSNQLVFLADLAQRLVDLEHTRATFNASTGEAGAAAGATGAAGAAGGAEAIAELPRSLARGSIAARESFSPEKFASTIATIVDMQARLRTVVAARIAADARLAAVFTPEVVARHDRARGPPQLLTSLHKIASFEHKLRSLKELCEVGYQRALARLHAIQATFSAPSMMLALQRAERSLAQGPLSMVLAVGGVNVTGFSSAGPLPAMVADAGAPLVQTLRADCLACDRIELGLCESLVVPGDAGMSSDSDDFEDARSCCDLSGQGSPGAQPFMAAVLAGNGGANTPPRLKSSGSWSNLASPNGGTVVAGAATAAAPAPRWAPSAATLARAAGGLRAQFSLAPRVSPSLMCAHPLNRPLLTDSDTTLGGELLRIRRLPWIRHLVFSLLKGRPVVVLAEPDHATDVRLFVHALTVFVPGLQRSVAPWLRRELTLADLGELKLVGMSRSLRMSKPVRMHCTFVDFEAEELTGPAYEEGTLVAELLGARTDWSEPQTLLAHIHLGLLQIGLAAMLHYYLCLVGTTPLWTEAGADLSWLVAAMRPTAATGPAASVPSSRESAAVVFAHMAVAGQDIEIVRYLSGLVRKQQVQLLQAVRPELGFDAVPRTISLDSAKVVTFKGGSAKTRLRTS